MNPRRRPLRRMQQATKTYGVVPEWFQHIGQDTSPNNPNHKVNTRFFDLNDFEAISEPVDFLQGYISTLQGSCSWFSVIC